MPGFGGSVKLTGEKSYKDALKQISTELKIVSADMKATAAAYEAGDKSQKEAQKAADDLRKSLDEQKKALEAVKKELPGLNKEYEAAKKNHESLSKDYEKESKTLEEIGKTMGKASAEYKEQQKVVNKLGQEVNKAANEEKRLGNDVNAARLQIAQAEASISQTSKALDTMGKEAEESGEAAAKSSEGYTVMKGVLANLATEGIKLALEGLKKLGSALIGVGKDAIASFADFEQLQGGVEKIFGDDAAKTVMDNAQNAFKTAGMSANEYMETVTGFSSSLIQSLGGDTVRAAELSDQAIRDMSDNANTFGTDMASLQNAYQGFAKGNMNMLDNLKLGYGGTKEEMLRLVKDAGVVSQSVKSLDDVSFDQMI